MRRIAYVNLPAFGPGEQPTQGSLADLVRDIPYLLVAGMIPPLPVVNEMLRRGECDAGMSGGCRWPPMELSSAEFSELVAELERDGAHGRAVHRADAPAWVTTQKEWSLWLAYTLHGVPVDENRALSDAMTVADQAGKDAAARGDEHARVGHFLELSRLTSAWNALIWRYRKPREPK